jgi:predicted enzyme related to lactoylglutathione lyase
MGNPVAMFEIVSTDPERLGRFYGELFGWSINADPAWGGYGLVDTHAEPGGPLTGGIGPSYQPGDTGVKFYVGVDDLGAWLGKAEGLGATRLVEPTDLPEGFGSFALFADPDGNTVGLWATAGGS